MEFTKQLSIGSFIWEFFKQQATPELSAHPTVRKFTNNFGFQGNPYGANSIKYAATE